MIEGTGYKIPIRYGLLGKELQHSFSKSYFTTYFEAQDIPADYELIELESIEDVGNLKLQEYAGLNVTIPYKISIIPYLDELSVEARKIGAVNCISTENGILKGHNTDAYGFKESLKPFLKSWHQKALILGTGGAAQAAAYALDQLGIECLFVSRSPTHGQLGYDEINEVSLRAFPFIVNASPVGMFPDIEKYPAIPYNFLGPENLLYDMVYNPDETQFIIRGRARGAQTMNGLSMLYKQAEKSWEIWSGLSE